MNKKTPFVAYYFSLDPDITQAQLKAKKSLPEVDVSVIKQRMDKNSICGIVQGEVEQGELHYPERLRSVTCSPYIVYYQWDLTLLDKVILWIVWPRKISTYGERIMKNLFTELSSYNVVTLSGMADGADTLCHELSLQHNIPTIAVLWGWFSYFLKGKKRELMKRIVEKWWLIISEFKHGFEPTNRSFPQRNRLIAGIVDVLFLPEAHKKSWSLITADMARKKLKPIYAPMWDILQQSSAWTNAYIVERKILPVDNLTILMEKHFARLSNVKQKIHIDFTTEEERIVQIIADSGWATIDILMQQTKYTSSSLLMYVNILEVKWVLYESSPWVYSIK